MLWNEARSSIELRDALDSLFGASPWRGIADDVFCWLVGHIPYRCGVRLGKGRLTFLIGNYRPAALKKWNGRLRVDMMFADRLPQGFRVASDAWRSVPGTTEGYIVLNDLPLLLSEEDVVRFIKACNLAKEIAPKSRRWDCNVDVTWPDQTPWP